MPPKQQNNATAGFQANLVLPKQISPGYSNYYPNDVTVLIPGYGMFKISPGVRVSRTANIRSSRTRTIWEAPTKIDNKINDEIEAAQINYGVESKEVVQLIWLRAKQYFDGHNYEKALKLLDQLEPLLTKKENSDLVSLDLIDKMRGQINLKLQRQPSTTLFGSDYSSQNQSKGKRCFYP